MNPIIEKVKVELEIRYKEYREKMETDDSTYYKGMADALDLFERFVDVLEKECAEKPTNIDFEQELYKHFGQVKDFTLGMQISKHFYELGKQEKPTTAEGLEEEIKTFTSRFCVDRGSVQIVEDIARHFAKWGAEHSDSSNVRFPNYRNIVDKVFGAGNLDSFEYEEAEALVSLAKDELLKDLMKEAVGGWVSSTQGDHFGCVTSVPTDLGKLYGADKCKIIIVKED